MNCSHDFFGKGALITTCDWCELDNKCWCALYDKNAICEIDKKRKKARVIGLYPGEKLSEKYLSISCRIFDNRVVFVPWNADAIAVYEIDNDRLIFLELDKSPLHNYKKYEEKFYNILEMNNKIYLFGNKIPTIINVDLNNGFSINVMDKWVKEIICKVPYSEDNNKSFFAIGNTLENGEAILALGYTDVIIRINLKTMQLKMDKIECKGVGFYSIAGEDDRLFLSCYCGGKSIVIVCKYENKKYKYISSFDLIGGPYYLSSGNNKLYMFSVSEGILYEKEGIEGDIKQILNEHITREYMASEKAFAIKVRKEGLILYIDGTRQMIIFKENGGMDKSQIEIEDIDYLERSTIQGWNDAVIDENNVSLRSFIDCLSKDCG